LRCHISVPSWQQLVHLWTGRPEVVSLFPRNVAAQDLTPGVRPGDIRRAQ
jgi:hypothetical protein